MVYVLALFFLVLIGATVLEGVLKSESLNNEEARKQRLLEIQETRLALEEARRTRSEVELQLKREDLALRRDDFQTRKDVALSRRENDSLQADLTRHRIQTEKLRQAHAIESHRDRSDLLAGQVLLTENRIWPQSKKTKKIVRSRKKYGSTVEILAQSEHPSGSAASI